MLYNKEREEELMSTISNLTEYIESDNKNAELYFKRALNYYQLSQQYYDIFEIFDGIGDKNLYFRYVNKAYQDVEKAISLKVKEDYAYYFKVFMLKKLKRWDEVIEYGLKLDDTLGCTSLEYSLIGEAHFNLKNWQKCIDFYTKVINDIGEKNANHIGVKIFIERGLAYCGIENFELALKDFLKHEELNKIFVFDCSIYGLIADTYKELNMYKEAIEYYTKLIEKIPEYSEPYFERGKLYCDYLNNYALAAKDFDKAIEYAKEENYFYYHNCGYAYVHKGEIDENNGNYELALQDYDKAIEAYKKAVPLDPIEDDGANTVGYAEYLKECLLEKLIKNNNLDYTTDEELDYESYEDFNSESEIDNSEYDDGYTDGYDTGFRVGKSLSLGISVDDNDNEDFISTIDYSTPKNSSDSYTEGYEMGYEIGLSDGKESEDEYNNNAKSDNNDYDNYDDNYPDDDENMMKFMT